MTANRLPGEVLGPDPTAAEAAQTLTVPAILALCDGLLGEVGRRNHLFSWLRVPEAAPAEWLPVDGYYPGRRLVVVCRGLESDEDRCYAELVPPRGLRLLQIGPGDLAGDLAQARMQLERRIAAIGAAPPPPPPSPAAAAEHQPEVPAPSPAFRARDGARRAALAGPDHHRVAAARSGTAAHSEAAGMLVGLVLAVAVALELYLGVSSVLLHGRLLLAAGIGCDACARSFGVVAAVKLGREDWAWGCAVIGSPAVAGFTLLQPSGAIKDDPAPLAGALAVIAIAAAAVALVASALGA